MNGKPRQTIEIKEWDVRAVVEEFPKLEKMI